MINELAKTVFNTAIIRGKTAKDMNHLDTFFGIFSELKEYIGNAVEVTIARRWCEALCRRLEEYIK